MGWVNEARNRCPSAIRQKLFDFPLCMGRCVVIKQTSSPPPLTFPFTSIKVIFFLSHAIASALSGSNVGSPRCLQERIQLYRLLWYKKRIIVFMFQITCRAIFGMGGESVLLFRSRVIAVIPRFMTLFQFLDQTQAVLLLVVGASSNIPFGFLGTNST